MYDIKGVKQLNQKRSRLTMLVLSGLFAALVTVSTIVIPIPIPTKGYINLGDCFVNISAWLLGPIYGAFAAGIGSATADLLLGYTVYAPGTFVIKALMAVASFYVFRLIAKRAHGFLARVLAAVSAELLMVFGYFLFEWFLYGSFGVSIAGVPANLMQGVGGVLISVPLHEALLSRIPVIKALEQGRNNRKSMLE